MSEAADRPDDLQRRKRSDRARLTLMAGAGVAALGVYAISGDISQPESTPAGPGGGCFRYYPSVETCTSARVYTAQQCQTAFAGLSNGKMVPDGIMIRSTDGSVTSVQAVWRQSATGRLVDDNGTDVEGRLIDDTGSDIAGRQCRNPSSSSSSRRSTSGSSWGFGGSSGSSGDSGHSSSTGYAGTSPAVSRGGFGSYGSHFSGGG